MTLEYEEIYPKIFVYKNVFKDIENTIKTIVDSDLNREGSALGDWRGWYTFGSEVDMFNHSLEESERKENEKNVWMEISEVFYKTTDHYSKHFGVPIEKDKMVFDKGTDSQTELWRKMGPSICKYEDGGGINDPDLAMHYHTDYQLDTVQMRGYKFAVTCTMYLNDDYRGGGIDFLVNNKLFYYKPKKGEVLVFPAGDPHYLSDNGELYSHAVAKVHGAPKYFIRNHWTWFYEGDKDWQESEELYGKEVWEQMEIERRKTKREAGEYQLFKPEEVKKLERINEIV